MFKTQCECVTAMSPIEYNKKSFALIAFGVVFAIYLIYTYYPNTAMSAKLKQHLTWKPRSLVDIPEEVLERAKTVKVEERHLSFDVDGKSHTVFLRESIPKTFASDHHIPVVFLHGAHSSSETWVETNSIRLVAAMGYRVIALDLPGWGKSEPNVVIDKDKRARFLERFLQQKKAQRPVLISPSMSGTYSIPFMMGKDPSTCDSRLRGFVPVAPVGAQRYIDAQYHRCEIPAMIVYGEKDKTLGLTSTNYLRNMANSEVEVFKGAEHPCYRQQPDLWHNKLYNFLLAVEREEG